VKLTELLSRIYHARSLIFTYKIFDLILDDSTSDLHQDFSRLLGDNPEKLKEFVPACGEFFSGLQLLRKVF
jgi:hypothetical protein